MKRSLVAAGAAIAALALAPLAQADSDSHGYWQYLNARGMMGNGPGQWDPDYLVRQGNSACTSLQQGSGDEVVLNQLEFRFPADASQTILYAAHHYLCP
jgi:hypothetical protein